MTQVFAASSETKHDTWIMCNQGSRSEDGSPRRMPETTVLTSVTRRSPLVSKRTGLLHSVDDLMKAHAPLVS